MLSSTSVRRGFSAGITKLMRDDRGLTTVEYVIILVLIAVGGIGAWNAFGQSLTRRVECSGQSIMNMNGECDGTGPNSNAARNPDRGQQTDMGQRTPAGNNVSNRQDSALDAPADARPAANQASPRENSGAFNGGVTKVVR